MKCIVTSSLKKHEFDEVSSVVLPAFLGELQILPGHAESFFVLKKGEGRVFLTGKDKRNFMPIEIGNGVCHVKDDIVSIIL